ncbi:Tim44 domain-containing protein [Roseixanthobacter pseudopolyaromaticivorans]|uniref:Tim44 domain-containing protein n=1 Tax=Xanthobacteraceae TaxID=335928 RepID=UPI0037274B84
MKIFKRMPVLMGVLALASAVTLTMVDHADARQGGGFGSRGGRTYQAPASTNTAPGAAPIQRSITPQPQPGMNTAGAATAARPGGMFGSGFGGALMRGLLIGGLVGMLFGGGLGGLSGFLGLLLQVALVGGLVFLAMRFFANRRQQPRPAGAGAPFPGPLSRDSMFGGPSRPSGSANGRSALGGLGGIGGGAPRPVPQQPAPANRVKDELGIGPQDLDAFERLLSEIQAAFSREDHGALAERTTPEVLAVFSEELRDNAARGVRNDVSDVKLLQGDLSEAWREGNLEYATVAMRYAIRDLMRDRVTGALAAGSKDAVSETTEVWTFVRPKGGQWKLSAIQDV